MSAPIRRSAGFSLIELMISASLVLIVMVVVTQVFTTQHRTYVVIDEISEAQQNLRAVSELIERDVRRAGYMVPTQAAVCAFDQSTGPDTLYVSKTDEIRTVFDLEDENLALTADKGAPVTGVTPAFNASGNSFSLTLARLWVDYAPDGDDFAASEGVIVVSETNPERPVACGKITSISGNTLTVDFGATSTGAVGSNANVLAIPAHLYELVEGTGNAPNRLLRNGRLLASDIEDFQLTYFFDEDADLVEDANELYGADTVDWQPWELTPSANRPDFSSLVQVGINIVTVTRQDDPNVHYQLGAGQATGNRLASSLPSGDGKRRRVNSTRVRLRNAL